MTGTERAQPAIASAVAPAGGFGARILALAEELAKWSEAGDRLACTYLTPAHRSVAVQLQSWMQSAGLEASIDAVGNVVGRQRSVNPQAKTLIVGSHYDTVLDAGKYDGRLGILTGLVVLEELARAGHTLPFHVELIAFAEEEGVRFATSYLGSSAVAGKFDRASLARRDAAGIALGDAIRAAGVDPDHIPALARRPQDLLGYLEVHIEQGPVLLEAGVPLGVVTAIAGCVRYKVTITGVTGHAGTVPMDVRRDALSAAAELALALERKCRETPGLVGTVGQFVVSNGAVNVIAGRCELTLDIRADEDGKLNAAIRHVQARIRQIESTRNVSIDVSEILHTPSVPCSTHLQERIADAVRRAGVDVRHLPSGAGHDAVMFHGVTELGMLFVRCGNGGVSHNPLETVTEADADVAARVLRDTLTSLGEGPA